ncbi:Bicarbonate transport ATP-binding protein CmpD (plasmid) [Aminobacter sp. MSH1]|uniref:ABC transporter ATP-binding protein n=1 Tax=Aminobacter sp. MSH1 TaxID=374606 RepID=UPI000D5048D0|nr:ABC transporter ATP-binding protein [Aminobacter sp. MSH1]AWC25828.1 Bicarbonate transport ATP-binding protein CmpD [Aminobacter sp. MSH1]
MPTALTENPNLAGSFLSLSNVGVTYSTRRGETRAIDNLTLEVEDGQFVAVLGPSGCGKSTMLRLIAGLLKPTLGQLLFKGQELDGPNKEVGIVFQNPTLLPWKTVRDNVMMPIRALKLPAEKYKDWCDELLEIAGLTDFALAYPHELSGGMQQRVGICRGLIHKPKLLLMDEPFAALDAMTREHMGAELQRIWMNTRKSVFFITHSIQEAIFLADRIVVLSARPARVVEIIDVNLPRPRNADTQSLPEFGRLSSHLRAHFLGDHKNQTDARP